MAHSGKVNGRPVLLHMVMIDFDVKKADTNSHVNNKAMSLHESKSAITCDNLGSHEKT